MLLQEMSSSEIKAAQRLIREAFLEDLAQSTDLTTNALVPEEAVGQISVVARIEGVLCGNRIAQDVFSYFDSNVSYTPQLKDGDVLNPGSVIAEISGPMRSLLTAERISLNFLTMLSGTSTLTHRFVDAVAGTKSEILDTRKTLPGLRELQKYAVRCGGGSNHRMGLFDAVLIKDNHLAWWRNEKSLSLRNAIEHVRSSIDCEKVLEIEVDTIEQFGDVLPAKPDIILLDNMNPDQLSEAVIQRDQQAPEVLLEASGGVTLDTISSIAATGVDRISVGALTHSAIALDIGFDWSR